MGIQYISLNVYIDEDELDHPRQINRILIRFFSLLTTSTIVKDKTHRCGLIIQSIESFSLLIYF